MKTGQVKRELSRLADEERVRERTLTDKRHVDRAAALAAGACRVAARRRGMSFPAFVARQVVMQAKSPHRTRLGRDFAQVAGKSNRKKTLLAVRRTPEMQYRQFFGAVKISLGVPFAFAFFDKVDNRLSVLI